MLAATALVVSFLAPSSIRTVKVQSRASIACANAFDVHGELPAMYRERWAADLNQTPSDEVSAAPDLTATAFGAVLGVGIAAFAGVQASELLVDTTLAPLNYGSATASAEYFDFIFDWVDFFALPPLSVGALAFSIAVSVDVAALSAVLYFLHLTIAESKAIEADAAAEGCLVIDGPEPVCGTISFDSSSDYACVETEDYDGNLRWVCA